MPRFEQVLWAATDARKLDPCTYSASGDYTRIFNDPLYQQFNTARDYDYAARRRFELYLERTSDARAACFLDLIQAKVTGREWTPRSVEPAPEPAQPRRPAEAASSPSQPVSQPVVREPRQETRQRPPSSPSLPSNLPMSGRLTYSGPPVPQHGEVVFGNLPPGPLVFTYDTRNWTYRLLPGENGMQRVVFISSRPGLQKRLEIQWLRR